MNGLDPDRFDPYKAMADAALPIIVPVAWIQARALAVARYVFIALFPSAAGVFYFLSWRAPSNSFEEAVFLELSSGFVFFWAAPFVLAVGRAHRVAVPVVGVLAAIALLLVAHESSGFWRSTLIECSIAISVLVGLDLAMTPWLSALEKKHKALEQDYADLKERLDDA